MEKQYDVLDVLSGVLFCVSIVAFVLTLADIRNDYALLNQLGGFNGGIISQIWANVCILWKASTFFKIWAISAIASTAVCWPFGGFCSLVMPVVSLYLPAVVNHYYFYTLVTVGIGTWVFIIGMNAIVFIIWAIISIPRMKDKEVSPAR